MRRTSAVCKVLLGLSALLLSPAIQCPAQQVPTEPASTHIFPAGGRRGTTVAVRVGGEFLPPHTRFRLVGNGVSAPPELVQPAIGNYEPSPRRKPGGTPINYPREWHSEITVDADAPLGTILWRVSSARGGCGGRPFIIGDLPEHIEAESNSTPDRAERLKLPVTVNGQIAGERDHDYYEVKLTTGEVLSVEMIAGRIGSAIDPVLEVFDLAGTRQTITEIREGSDPIIAFQAPQTGAYRVLISNLSFRGGPQYVYRATFSTFPYIASVFPPAVPLKGDVPTLTTTVELFPLLGMTPEPVRLTATLRGPRLGRNAAELPIPTANRVQLEALAEEPILEREPNSDRATANSIVFGRPVFGRSDPLSASDWYAFDANAGEAVMVTCHAVAGDGAFLELLVTDAQGAPLAQARGVQLFPRPCRLEWRTPAAGKFFIQVNDSRGNHDELVYRLQVEPAKQDFSLVAATDIVNVLQGGRAELDIRVNRFGGMGSPIDLDVIGLPEGVKVEPTQIPANVEQFKLAVIAIDDTRPNDSHLRISGSVKNGSETLVRPLTAIHLGHDLEGNAFGDPTTDHVQLTVRHKQVFRLFCSEAYQYAHRGTIHPYLMEVERMNGFDGPISIEMGDRQIMDHDGVQVQAAEFAQGVSQIMLPLHLPENMHINVQPHSNIYAQGVVIFKDKWGDKQAMLQVSEMRCMIRPLPTVARLKATDRSLTARPGSTVPVHLQLDRTTNFTGTLRIQLVAGPSGVSFEPVQVVPGKNQVVGRITFDSTVQNDLRGTIRLRGTGELDRGTKDLTTVVTEVEIPIEPLPTR